MFDMAPGRSVLVDRPASASARPLTEFEAVVLGARAAECGGVRSKDLRYTKATSDLHVMWGPTGGHGHTSITTWIGSSQAM
jgi:hypothetical protein